MRVGPRERRVLHVITDTNRRGAQVFAQDLLTALDSRGCTGRLVALRAGDAGAQLPVATLGVGHLAPATLRRLRREIAGSEVVVAHGSHTLPACVLAGTGLGVPLVYRNISDPAYWMSTWSRRLRVRTLLSRVDEVVALWPGGAGFLVGRLHVHPAEVDVIPNAVHLADFRPPTAEQRRAARQRFGLPDDAPVLLYVAALQPEKHPETAVEALAALPPTTHLLMLGDGARRAAVTALAGTTAPGRVVVAGQVADVLQGYWAADVIVLPSEGEGLPAVLIEAALCGLPAVASSSGGNADIVLDGVTGRVVPPGAPRQLATAVSEVLAERQPMGDKARLHCRERYGMDLVADRWLEVIDRLAPPR